MRKLLWAWAVAATLLLAYFIIPTTAQAGPPGAVGDLYVAGLDKVVQFEGMTGALVGTFVAPGSGGLDRPQGMAFGPNGNFFVCDRNLSSGVGNGILEYDGQAGVLVGVGRRDDPLTRVRPAGARASASFVACAHDVPGRLSTAFLLRGSVAGGSWSGMSVRCTQISTGARRKEFGA